MCPACLTTLALIAAGALSTSGLAAAIVKKAHSPSGANANPNHESPKTEQGGN